MIISNKEKFRQQAKKAREDFVLLHSKDDLLDLELQRVMSFFNNDKVKTILSQPESCVGLYSAINNEASTKELINSLAKLGHHMALPRINGDGSLTFHHWSKDIPLIESNFGILEPSFDLPIVIPDIYIVPLLAFDKDYHRLGYGKGHYDRYFDAHKKGLKIGWAYDCQEIEASFVEPHDVSLDNLIL